LYVIVIEEPKIGFKDFIKQLKRQGNSINPKKSLLDNMANAVFSKMFGGSDEAKIFEYNNIEVDGLKAVIFSVVSKSIFYQFGLIEGKYTLYQIISWTLTDNANTFEYRMKKIVQSFKEV